MTIRGGRRRKQLDDLEEKIGWWELKEVALDRTVRRIAMVDAMDLS